MTSTPSISASLEDYLEAIIVAARDIGSARVRDIAARLDVRSASVTGALRALAEKGLIHYAPYEVVTLTPEGEKLARGVLRRHETLKAFFIKVLGAEESEAESAACGMEHALPRSLLERMTAYVQSLDERPKPSAEPAP
jgi:DtxR family transcriptional regulator, Mn-dependent transcriptional regulator